MHVCRASVAVYRINERSLEAQVSALQSVGGCAVSNAHGKWPPTRTLWQGPIDGLPAAPARTALLQVQSNCSKAMAVNVQVLHPLKHIVQWKKTYSCCVQAVSHPSELRVYVIHTSNTAEHVQGLMPMLQSPSCKGPTSAQCCLQSAPLMSL